MINNVGFNNNKENSVKHYAKVSGPANGTTNDGCVSMIIEVASFTLTRPDDCE